ncbi:MAG: hypothetical protein M0D53_08620 [Flavobacterium sp. JAD_PAG50586_2]|nr:MAG: hypothetical protein M0D53_08620 [Flavobacterium sp. JAD_PAG50586_2]
MRLTLFILLSPLFFFSQNQNILVTYKVKMTSDDKLATNEVLKEYYKSAIENAKYLEFKLIVSGDESYFYSIENLDNSSSGGVEFSKAFCGYTSTTYSEKIRTFIINLLITKY